MTIGDEIISHIDEWLRDELADELALVKRLEAAALNEETYIMTPDQVKLLISLLEWVKI